MILTVGEFSYLLTQNDSIFHFFEALKQERTTSLYRDVTKYIRKLEADDESEDDLRFIMYFTKLEELFAIKYSVYTIFRITFFEMLFVYIREKRILNSFILYEPFQILNDIDSDLIYKAISERTNSLTVELHMN